MKIGFFGFNNGVLAESEAMARALMAMDEAGFESAWTGEHVVLIDPREPPSPAPPDFPMLDTVAALAFAAGITQRIRLASGIILLAQRNPVVLAKELSGIDRLSKGRLIFGVGVGYVPREFEVIGVPYRERGVRVSEHIEAIRALWTQEQPEFEGRFTQISGVRQQPMPIQQPHPPIIIGGMSEAAYRRAVRQGNGWYGFAQTVEAAAESIAGLKEAAAVEGAPGELGRTGNHRDAAGAGGCGRRQALRGPRRVAPGAAAGALARRRRRGALHRKDRSAVQPVTAILAPCPMR